MTTDELRERIRAGEDANTEFKDERVQAADLAAAFVSFANSRGGWVLVGVDNRGNPSGVGNADEVLNRIDDVGRNNVEPPLPAGAITVERHLLGASLILAVNIARGPQRPYRSINGVYYIRALAGRRAATWEELR